MADVVARSTEPALGAIKLAWWRERLEELDDGKVPAEVDFDDRTIGQAGQLYIVAHAGRRGVIDMVAAGSAIGQQRMPRRARTLTGLAALAARDLLRGGPPFEPEASPGRAWTLLRHRVTGKFPRG